MSTIDDIERMKEQLIYLTYLDVINNWTDPVSDCEWPPIRIRAAKTEALRRLDVMFPGIFVNELRDADKWTKKEWGL